MATHAHHHVHPHTPDMLSVEEALERVLALVAELPAADAALLDADGLTLADDVAAPFAIPSLDNSAMDGYAVRAADVAGATEGQPVALRVVGQVQAGALPAAAVSEGEAVRIMTGAPIPPGADAIVPWELTDEAETRALRTSVAVRHAASVGDHVRPAGEDTPAGAVVLRKGRVLDPPSLGLLASFGLARVHAVRRPRVGVLATGDELLAPGEPHEPGKLYDSNSYGVASAVRRWGAEPVFLGIAPDEPGALRKKLREGLETDLLITSAGVSGGAFDLVKDALSEMGEIDFWSVRMRPSRPLAFGALRRSDGAAVPHIGLPGNPASALVALVKFARPALGRMMGRAPEGLRRIEAVMDERIVNFDGRRVYARVALEWRDGEHHARLTGAQGSNLLTSVAAADGLAICHEDAPAVEVGERTTVEMLDW